MKKKHIRLLIGICLILLGSGLLTAASVKRVQIVVNGESRVVRTLSSRVTDILRTAHIGYTSADRIRPGLTERVRNGGRISISSAVNITLETDDYPQPVSYISHQRFGGNMLLDAGLRIFPGDRLFWDGIEIRPDLSLAGVSELKLRLERANVFTLVTEEAPAGKSVYGSGATVGEALRSAGITLNRSTLILPDETSAFTKGMTIEVLPLRELTISRGGRIVTVTSAGATVGEALARAGIPLMGANVSIPAAGERLPTDGRILIVPVSDAFTMNAEIIRRTTDWTANAELDLDDTRLISEGTDGLRGSFTRVRMENGREVLRETSPETVLVQPVNEQREYGTKITIRTLDTPDGPIEYYRAISVYATSYSPCRSGVSGCITGTASGMKVQKGVAAVTSSWYNQFGGQSIYVPGYGKAVIADVGGGIAGKRWIDLAYEDDNFEGWSRETMLYFLTPVPADMVWVLQ